MPRACLHEPALEHRLSWPCSEGSGQPHPKAEGGSSLNCACFIKHVLFHSVSQSFEPFFLMGRLAEPTPYPPVPPQEPDPPHARAAGSSLCHALPVQQAGHEPLPPHHPPRAWLRQVVSGRRREKEKKDYASSVGTASIQLKVKEGRPPPGCRASMHHTRTPLSHALIRPVAALWL